MNSKNLNIFCCVLAVALIGMIETMNYSDAKLSEQSYCEDVESNIHSNYKNIDCKEYKK